MLVGTTLSFVVMYWRGVSHRPNSVNTVEFVWPMSSLTFLMQAAFICIGLPLLHFLYTFPAYFVRAGLGRALRALLKAVLITFPFFLLNGKVAYLVNEEDGAYLLKNNGSKVELRAVRFTVSGDGLKSYVFTVGGERFHTFAFIESEMPVLEP